MAPSFRVALLASCLAVGFGGQAWAHAHLKTATPPLDGSVQAAPTELDLGFSEGVNPSFSGVRVTGPGGAAVPSGAARSGPAGDGTLVVPLTGRLAPGVYRVDWHALATDGHKTEGAYTFTVAP